MLLVNKNGVFFAVNDNGDEVALSNPVILEVLNPEGVVDAPPFTQAFNSVGELWLKASGSGNTGWIRLLTSEDLILDGGSF